MRRLVHMSVPSDGSSLCNHKVFSILTGQREVGLSLLSSVEV